MRKYKVRRMTRHLRPRSFSCKTRHIMTLSLIGFACYAIATRWTGTGRRTSLLQTLHNLLPDDGMKTGNQIYQRDLPRVVQPLADKGGSKVRSLLMNAKPVSFVQPVAPDVVKDSPKVPVAEKVVEEKVVENDKEELKSFEDNRAKVVLKSDGYVLPAGSAAKQKPQLHIGSNVTPAPGATWIPIILVWKAMEYQMKQYKTHLEFYLPRECGSCHITTNRSVAEKSDAVVLFNHPELRRVMDVPDPKTRNPNQIYAFWARETPSKTYPFHEALKDPRFDGIFNLTMNFRLDSDVIDYFGNTEWELRFFRAKNADKRFYNKLMTRKTGLAVWAVSNCNSTHGASERMKYAQTLIDAGLRLTRYGSCFNRRYTNAEMVEDLMNHKFYMSLENSIHCPDYVSEKFWRNGLRSGAVPVVWGPTREDVAAIAPPHSYIHTDDYDTPEKLVEYLNYLDKNDTAYREYHAWRFQPIDESIPEADIKPSHRSMMCRLCKRIVNKPLVHKTVPSVHDWLYNTRYVDNECFKS